MVFSYRAFFGGAREGGCLFCPERRSELKTIVHENEEILVIKNRGLAGIEHWLIIPHRHIRDIESLEQADLPLLEAINTVKDALLDEHYPNVPRSEVYAGYHRGHRALGGPFGTFGWPDIVSIHHLHLHVIVQPYWYASWFKYPYWLPMMWVSDGWVREKFNSDSGPQAESGDDPVTEAATKITASDTPSTHE